MNPAQRPSLFVRPWLPRLLRRYPPRVVWAVFVGVNGFITIALLAAVAALSGTPFVFPSLGPTAFVFFFSPQLPAACPRDALCGHAIGILSGYGALALVGLTDAPPALAEGIDMRRVLAAAVSLAATGALMILVNRVHAPAAATTLIVALGIITRPWDLLLIEFAVVLLAVQAFCLNRLAGLDDPLWAPRLTAHDPAAPPR
jgi:CBS domain-containing membrane protein